jgi:Ser-tRNA(Ala) deacylase AlaX
VTELKIEGKLILHYGSFKKGTAFTEGIEVSTKIDEEKRKLYARLHSAGHLMDVCVRNIGLTNLQPGKGFHFPSGAYVEYIGLIPEERKTTVIDELNADIQRVLSEVSEEDKVFMKILEYEEAKAILGDVPPYIQEGHPFRVVKLVKDDRGCPCGGTHVPHIKDIGTLKVTKIKKEKKNTRISYVVE